jgi:hypothetical protein
MPKKKKTSLVLYIVGIAILVGSIAYGGYIKVSQGLEFQASLMQVATQIEEIQQEAKQQFAKAQIAHKQQIQELTGDFDAYYVESFNKNQFVRVLDEIIQDINTNSEAIVLNSLNFANPVISQSGLIESIPISMELQTTKVSLLEILKKFETVGLDKNSPFYLVELRSLAFRIPAVTPGKQVAEDFVTSLNLNISKTLSQ